jgi:hypothetical protein
MAQQRSKKRKPELVSLEECECKGPQNTCVIKSDFGDIPVSSCETDQQDFDAEKKRTKTKENESGSSASQDTEVPPLLTEFSPTSSMEVSFSSNE